MDFSSAINYVVSKARLLVIHLSAVVVRYGIVPRRTARTRRGECGEGNSAGVVLLSADTSDTDTDTDI